MSKNISKIHQPSPTITCTYVYIYTYLLFFFLLCFSKSKFYRIYNKDGENEQKHFQDTSAKSKNPSPRVWLSEIPCENSSSILRNAQSLEGERGVENMRMPWHKLSWRQFGRKFVYNIYIYIYIFFFFAKNPMVTFPGLSSEQRWPKMSKQIWIEIWKNPRNQIINKTWFSLEIITRR